MCRLIPTKLPIGNRTGSEYLQVPCKVSNKQRETALANRCQRRDRVHGHSVKDVLFSETKILHIYTTGKQQYREKDLEQYRSFLSFHVKGSGIAGDCAWEGLPCQKFQD